MKAQYENWLKQVQIDEEVYFKDHQQNKIVFTKVKKFRGNEILLENGHSFSKQGFKHCQFYRGKVYLRKTTDNVRKGVVLQEIEEKMEQIRDLSLDQLINIHESMNDALVRQASDSTASLRGKASEAV